MLFRLIFCGDIEIRTLDPLLAKQVLYQLSYTPELVTRYWFSRPWQS